MRSNFALRIGTNIIHYLHSTHSMFILYKAMPEAVRGHQKNKTMAWFSKTVDYSTKDSGFYGEPEITYGSKKDDSGSGTSSTSGAWGDYQRERERIISSFNNHSR